MIRSLHSLTTFTFGSKGGACEPVLPSHFIPAPWDVWHQPQVPPDEDVLLSRGKSTTYYLFYLSPWPFMYHPVFTSRQSHVFYIGRPQISFIITVMQYAYPSTSLPLPSEVGSGSEEPRFAFREMWQLRPYADVRSLWSESL